VEDPNMMQSPSRAAHPRAKLVEPSSLDSNQLIVGRHPAVYHLWDDFGILHVEIT